MDRNELNLLRKDLTNNAKDGKLELKIIKESKLKKKERIDKIVVAFGSYNPLSVAHESLFIKGLSTIKTKNALNELLIVTSTTHFDKEVIKNSTLCANTQSLLDYASCHSNVSIALFNDPYFFNLIPCIQNLYGKDIEINFVVGSDVMEKIVNSDGYIKRGLDSKEILNKLFLHNFIVCQRNLDTKDGKRIISLDELKEKYPVLTKYSNKLISIDINDKYDDLKIPIQDVNSTTIRNKINERESNENLKKIGLSKYCG